MPLAKRIEKLEQCLRPRQEEPAEEGALDWEQMLAFINEHIATADQEKNHPLEDQLAVARVYARRSRTEHVGCQPNRRFLQCASDGLYERWDAARIRELEIAIMERDGQIDTRTADELRENASAHLRLGAELFSLKPSRA